MVVKNGKQVMITPKENFVSLKDQCGYMLAEKINARAMRLIVEDIKRSQCNKIRASRT